MSIGTKLRALRFERNLTLEQVAGAASLSKSYVSQLENDNCNPSLNSLRAVMNVYGLPLAVLFEHPEMQPPVAVVRKSKRKTYTFVFDSIGTYRPAVRSIHSSS